MTENAANTNPTTTTIHPARSVAQVLSRLVGAIHNCIKTDNIEWRSRHESNMNAIIDDFLPSGSGWDNGTKINLADSTEDELIFDGSYHHMDESGSYDGWTDHTITVTPTFSGVSVEVSGRNRNDIKEYLGEMFQYALDCPIRWDAARARYVSAREQA